MNTETTKSTDEMIPFLEEYNDQEQVCPETKAMLVKGAQAWENNSSNGEEFYL